MIIFFIPVYLNQSIKNQNSSGVPVPLVSRKRGRVTILWVLGLAITAVPFDSTAKALSSLHRETISTDRG